MLEILAATIFVSLLSLVGIVFVVRKSVDEYMGLMVSFAAGALLAVAFLDLIPESLSLSADALKLTMVGMIGFFVLEKALFWHHHHSKIHRHPMTTLNLVGDGIHNFLDGTIIAAAFLQNTELGLTTTFAVAAHEIPQEFGDYSILIYGGFTHAKALFYNFLSALTAIAGALVMFYFSAIVPGLSSFMLPFAAGGLLYIAGTDLIPELKKEVRWKKSVIEFASFLAGIGLIWLLISIFE